MIDEKKLIEHLKEIANEHPYKIQGNPDSYSDYSQGWADCADRMISIVENMPQLDTFGEWIQVSERYPKETGEYLVWYDCGEDAEKGYAVTDFDEDIGMFGFWNDYYDPHTLGFLDSEFNEFETVVAWQRLPEPFKGE